MKTFKLNEIINKHGVYIGSDSGLAKNVLPNNSTDLDKFLYYLKHHNIKYTNHLLTDKNSNVINCYIEKEKGKYYLTAFNSANEKILHYDETYDTSIVSVKETLSDNGLFL